MNTAGIIVSIVVAIFGSTGFWNWLMNRGKKKSAESKLLMGIAYSQIISLCESYLKKGFVSTNEFHELEHYLYMPYSAMGGNGTAEKLYEDVKKLKVKDDQGGKGKAWQDGSRQRA